MLKYSKQIESNFGLCQIHSAGTIAVESLLYYVTTSFIDGMSQREGTLGLLLNMAFYLVIS